MHLKYGSSMSKIPRSGFSAQFEYIGSLNFCLDYSAGIRLVIDFINTIKITRTMDYNTTANLKNRRIKSGASFGRVVGNTVKFSSNKTTRTKRKINLLKGSF